MTSSGLPPNDAAGQADALGTAPKKSRTNTPWSPAEESLLKEKRDLGQTWGEIAKVDAITFSDICHRGYRILILFRVLVLPSENGRQCQKALVQGQLRVLWEILRFRSSGLP